MEDKEVKGLSCSGHQGLHSTRDRDLPQWTAQERSFCLTHKVLFQYRKTYIPLITIMPGVADDSFVLCRELLHHWVLGFINSRAHGHKVFLYHMYDGVTCPSPLSSVIKRLYRNCRTHLPKTNGVYVHFSFPSCTLTFPWHKSPSFHIHHHSSASAPTPARFTSCQGQFPEDWHSITFPIDAGVKHHSLKFQGLHRTLKSQGILQPFA